MLSLRFPTDAKVDWREWLLAEKSLDNCQVSLKALVGWGSGKVMLASVQQPLLDLITSVGITRCYMGAVWLITALTAMNHIDSVVGLLGLIS